MEFDLRFSELVHTYQIDRHHPWFYEKVRAERLLKDFWLDWLENHHGENMTLLYEKRGDFENFYMSMPQGVNYTKVKYRNDDVSSFVECIPQIMDGGDKGNVMLITQKDHVRISAELEREGLAVLDLYDYFALHGLEFYHEYYLISNEKYFDESGEVDEDTWQNNRYETLFYDKRKYRTAQDEALQQYYLERVIFDYYSMRDFINGEIYLKEYLCRQTSLAGEYENFLTEVKDLLFELQQTIKQKNEKDIVMYWIDCISYEEDAKVPHGNYVSSKALVFSRSFTVIPITSDVMGAMFYQRMPAEAVGKSKLIEDAPLIDMLNEKGWKFWHYGWGEMFAKRYVRTVEQDKIHRISSEAHWKLICDMAEQTEPAFRLVHLMGLHPPYLSAEMDGERFISLHDRFFNPDEEVGKKRAQQRIQSMQYEYRQIEFFEGLIEARAVIYFSDHGCMEYVADNFPMLHHNILKVKAENIYSGVCKQIFSPLDFLELISKLINGKAEEINSIASECVLMQGFPIYNKEHVRSYYNLKHFSEFLLGYNGIVKGDYIYFYFHAGYDLCYKMQEEKIYLMGVNESREVRRQLLEEIRGTDRLLWDFSHEKFRYSRVFFQVRDRAAEREDIKNIQREGELFCSRFLGEYPDSSVFAIRGGGNDTVLFLDALPQEHRRKIQYIVDGNLQCNASHFGIPVVQPALMDWAKVTHVIVISSNYREQMLAELEDKPQITAIDLYRRLWDAGFEERRTLVDILIGKRRTYVEEDFPPVDWDSIGRGF